MANRKRNKQPAFGTTSRPSQPQQAAPQSPAIPPAATPATGKTMFVATGPAAERAAFMRRRAGLLAGGLLALVLVSALGYAALAGRGPAPAAPAAPLATAAPEPTAPPEPTASPAAQLAANPTAALSAGSAAPTAAIACAAIAGLPVYSGATCTKQDTDQEDGATKRENTYVATATADEIRQFFEGAFAQHGWTLGEFTYELAQGPRRAQIKVEPEQGASGSFTKVQLIEHGGPAPAGATCAPIMGLPALPDAACIKFDADQDDGVRKLESTYSTSAPPDQVWRIYANALTQGGWSGQEFSYSVQQGASTLKINVEAQPSAPNAQTEFKIAEK